METLETGIAEYAVKFKSELRDSALRAIINAKFLEYLILAIKERRKKVEDLLLQTEGEIKNHAEKKAQLQGQEAYEYEKTFIAPLEKKCVNFKHSNKRDDDKILNFEQQVEDYHRDAHGDNFKLEFLEKNPVTLDSFKKYVSEEMPKVDKTTEPAEASEAPAVA